MEVLAEVWLKPVETKPVEPQAASVNQLRAMELEIKRQEILLRKQELEEIRLECERKDQLRCEEMNQVIELMKLENDRKEREMQIENEERIRAQN